MLNSLTNRIARSPGDPKVEHRGPSSLTFGDRLARSLGMFSVALGIVELLAPQTITRALGLEGKEGVIRAYGARELSAAVPTMSMDKQVGLLMRIAGDAVDLATVAPALRNEDGQRRNALVTLGALLVVTGLDIVAAMATSATHKRTAGPPRDYTDRSGLPRGVEGSRGLARRDNSAQA